MVAGWIVACAVIGNAWLTRVEDLFDAMIDWRIALLVDPLQARRAFCSAAETRRESACEVRVQWREDSDWSNVCGNERETRGVARYWRILGVCRVTLLGVGQFPVVLHQEIFR